MNKEDGLISCTETSKTTDLKTFWNHSLPNRHHPLNPLNLQRCHLPMSLEPPLTNPSTKRLQKNQTPPPEAAIPFRLTQALTPYDTSSSLRTQNPEAPWKTLSQYKKTQTTTLLLPPLTTPHNVSFKNENKPPDDNLAGSKGNDLQV